MYHVRFEIVFEGAGFEEVPLDETNLLVSTEPESGVESNIPGCHSHDTIKVSMSTSDGFARDTRYLAGAFVVT